MKTINFRSGITNEIVNICEQHNITMTCNANMDIEISDEDYAKFYEVAPCAADDIYEVED